MAKHGSVAGLLVLLTFTMAQVACSPDSAEPDDGEPKGLLRVATGGLPAGVTGQVKVEAGSSSWDLTGTRELELEPGTYRITVQPVRTTESGKALTRRGSEDVREVRVAAGEAIDVDARHRLAVPDATKIIEEGSASPIVRLAADTVELAAGPYADALRPGDAIVAGHTPATPGGLSARVVSVQRSAGRVTARTAPLRLTDAIPAGVLSIADGAPGGDPADELAVSGSFSVGRVHASGDFKAKVEQDWSGTEISWELVGDQKYVEVKISHRTRTEHELGWEFAAQASSPELRKELDLGVCGHKVMKVAKVAAPLTCDLEAYVALRPTLKGAMRFSAQTFQGSHRQTRWRQGGQIGPDDNSASKGANSVGKVTVGPAAEGSVEATGGMQFSYRAGAKLLDIGLGAFLEVGTNAEVTAQGRVAARQPTFEASAKTFFRVGYVVDLSLMFGLLEEPLIKVPAWTHTIGTWSDDLDPGEVNRRQPHIPKYSLADIRQALPGYQPAGYQSSISSGQPYGSCLDSHVDGDPLNDCPMAESKEPAASVLLHPAKRPGWLEKPTYWLEAHVFATHEQAEAFTEKLRRRAAKWGKGGYRTPGGRKAAGYRQWAEGVSAVEDPFDLQGSRYPGAIRVKRSQQAKLAPPGGGPAAASPEVVQEFIYYRRHNVVIEAGGDQLAGPGADPTAEKADAIPGVTTVLLGYLNELGEPR